MMIVIGVDPDSDKHGVAVYQLGKLTDLGMKTSIEIIGNILDSGFDPKAFLVSIENVMANQFVYARNQKASKAAQSKVAMHIGRCQQAQVELMRMLDHYDVPYVLHRPQKGNWADNKALFEKITGWQGRSNSDTRAAAFFGYLGINKK